MCSQSREIDSAARVSQPRGIFFDLCILKLSYCSFAPFFLSSELCAWGGGRVGGCSSKSCAQVWLFCVAQLSSRLVRVAWQHVRLQ